MDYGERLKQLRLSRDLKQSDLADILGISASAIGTYERCERQPPFELLHEYSNIFNVSIDYMLCNSDEKLTVEEYRLLDTHSLNDLLANNTVTLAGVVLSDADKKRIIDIATVLCFDKLKL